MNSLSWMIYFADVAGSLRGLLTFIGVICAVATLVLLLTLGLRKFDPPPIWSWEKPDEKRAEIAALNAGLARMWPKTATVAVVSALIATIIPGKSTIYAIAASQYGQRLAKTETASKAVQALNAWLDRQIAGQPPQGGK